MRRHLYDIQYVTQYIGLLTNCQENSSAVVLHLKPSRIKKICIIKGGKIFKKCRKYFTIF